MDMGLSEQRFWHLTPAKFSLLFGRLRVQWDRKSEELKMFDFWFARAAMFQSESVNVQVRTEENKSQVPIRQTTDFLVFRDLKTTNTVGPTVAPYDVEEERAKWKGWALGSQIKRDMANKR
jgi:hypothetical protein